MVFLFHFFQLGPVGITFPECDVLLKISFHKHFFLPVSGGHRDLFVFRFRR